MLVVTSWQLSYPRNFLDCTNFLVVYVALVGGCCLIQSK